MKEGRRADGEVGMGWGSVDGGGKGLVGEGGVRLGGVYSRREGGQKEVERG